MKFAKNNDSIMTKDGIIRKLAKVMAYLRANYSG
jgi:hypothetical protein